MQAMILNIFSEDRNYLKDKGDYRISRLKEIELINLCKGDIKHFKPLYECYHHQILNYIYQKVGEKDIAADLTSQVFLNAMTHIGKYKIQAVPFSAWLYRIAYNESMLFFRKSKKMRMVILDENLLKGLESELEKFSKEDILQAMEASLNLMKPSELELIELKFFEGKNYREIGYIIGCTENTAKVRTHRLIKRLRDQLLKSQSV